MRASFLPVANRNQKEHTNFASSTKLRQTHSLKKDSSLSQTPTLGKEPMTAVPQGEKDVL